MILLMEIVNVNNMVIIDNYSGPIYINLCVCVCVFVYTLEIVYNTNTCNDILLYC